MLSLVRFGVEKKTGFRSKQFTLSLFVTITSGTKRLYRVVGCKGVFAESVANTKNRH